MTTNEDPGVAESGLGVGERRLPHLFERSARVPVRRAGEYLSALEDLSAALDTYVGISELPAEVRAILRGVDVMLDEAPMRSESHGF